MTGAAPSGSPQPRGAGRSELNRRVISALALATVAVAVTWYGGIPFASLWAVAAACVVAEWFVLIAPHANPVASGDSGDRRLIALRLFAAAGTGAVPLLVTAGWHAVAITVAVLALGAAVGWGLVAPGLGANDDGWRRRFGDRLVAWALGGIFVGGLVGLVPVLARDLPAIGATLIAWMFAVVWTTDIAAYFTGRAIGGPKLWPRVSPNKTWAGFWGGAVGGTFAGWLVSLVARGLGVDVPWSAGVVLAVSLLASVLGQGGDLAESALKRLAGVKDSGRIIPGHGGVLDRVDAFLAVCALVAIGLASGVLAAH